MSDDENLKIINIASSRPSDAEIAAALKHRLMEAMIPVLKIMDEALAHRMHVRWDALGPVSNGFEIKNGITNLQIVRIY